VFAANIGEGDDPESVARGRALSDLCERTGLRACGPNCMGLVSAKNRVFAYPNQALCRLPAGNVAAVFQSGGAMMHWASAAGARGIRFSHMITSGNEIDLVLADYVDYLVDDPYTDIIVLLVEAIRRPEAFMQAASRALAARKPIIALKTGRNEASQESALSHTGAVCGDFDAYLAMCERLGIVNCPTYEALIETVLAFQGGRYPKGGRIGFMTISGGVVDLLHDYIEQHGAQVPDFTAETKAALADLVNPGMKLRNPLDGGGGAGFGPEPAARVCGIAADDPNIDMVAWTMRLPSDRAKYRQPKPLLDMLNRTDKPILAFERSPYTPTADDLDFQSETGIPFLQGLEATVGALTRLGFYGERVNRPMEPLPGPAPQADPLDDMAIAASLADAGVPGPASAEITTPEEAAEAAQTIGFPVVLKIRSAQILHKTEAGGVRLHLSSPEEVMRAAHDMTEAARRAVPDAQIDGYAVQEMVKGVEFLVGCRTDPFYGPLIAIGAGGVLVELFRDVAFRLLPVTPDIVADMLHGLKSAPLLDGYRGAPPADKTDLINAVCAVGTFFLENRSWLQEMEINPLTVLAAGEGVRAVDVRPIR
jgi:acetyltransferase